MFLFDCRLAGKCGLEPILLTQRNKASKFFYNIKKEIPFPITNLLYKLNENIMLPGSYPGKFVSRVRAS